MVVVHALTAGVSQILQVVSIALLEPVMYSLMLTLGVVFMCISQYTIMQDISPARGNALEIVGAVTVFLGTVVGPFYRMYEETKAVNANTADQKKANVPEKRKS